MSSLTDFISQVKTDGLARSNRFSVNITFPVDIGTPANKILIFCDAVSMPGMNLTTSQAKTYGEQREFPYEVLFDNVTFTFYVDTNLAVKNAFEKWMASIRNPQTRTFNYYSNYVTDIDIYVHNVASDEEVVHSVTLHEAYPKTLTPIQMDYSSKDVMKYSVSMNYKWYTTSEMDATSAVVPQTGMENQDPQGIDTGTGYPATALPTVGGSAIPTLK